MAKKKVSAKERTKVAAKDEAKPGLKVAAASDAPTPRELVAEGLVRIEEAMKAYNLAGACITDGQKFIAEQAGGEARLKALIDFFAKAEFGLSSLRDELAISLGQQRQSTAKAKAPVFTAMECPVPQIHEQLIFTSAPTPQDVLEALAISGITLGIVAEADIKGFQSEQHLRVLMFHKKLHDSLKAMATVAQTAPAK